jgi:hypothetical protein
MRVYNKNIGGKTSMPCQKNKKTIYQQPFATSAKASSLFV